MFDPTLQELAKQSADTAQGLGQLTISANLLWTCVCAFMVMFMLAGFALVETGLTRSKNSIASVRGGSKSAIRSRGLSSTRLASASVSESTTRT